MKKFALLLFVFLAFAAVSKAQSKFGLGIIVGEPTGLSGKLIISKSSAVDGALAWSFGDYGALHIHGDYLYNFTRLSNEVPAYVGIGGRVKLQDSDKKNDTRFGLRIPVGIAYEPSTAPIDLFVEVVPIMDLTPDTDFSWNAAAGIRYWF
ncbi:MAG: hypothetical protein MUE56_09100 [Ignavibacteria bacterium]|nr:hypothetical protein [Ignavibacteria bacterium]